MIANTVKRAQQYYEMINHEMKGVNIILYHAQYLMPDRGEKELELLRKMGKESQDTDRNRIILVGTQVLEQSLDYDADIMFMELCPVDLLLQRIGRLQRHERNGMKEGYSRPEKLHLTECYILMDETDNGMLSYDEGSSKIYTDYLLTRTKKLLPDTICIPEDIPKLVQTVYCEDEDLGLETDSEYVEMKDKYFTMIGTKKSKAKSYLLKKPKNGIAGILTNDDKSSENNGESRVRDGGTTIEVILMRDDGDGYACFTSEKYGCEKILKNCVPEEKTARKVLRQRIRLPQIFSTDWMIGGTIDELEKRQDEIAEWQKSPWLSGELIILLDNNNETSLCGYRLHYDFLKGLVYEKQEEMNEG